MVSFALDIKYLIHCDVKKINKHKTFSIGSYVQSVNKLKSLKFNFWLVRDNQSVLLGHSNS